MKSSRLFWCEANSAIAQSDLRICSGMRCQYQLQVPCPTRDCVRRQPEARPKIRILGVVCLIRIEECRSGLIAKAASPADFAADPSRAARCAASSRKSSRRRTDNDPTEFALLMDFTNAAQPSVWHSYTLQPVNLQEPINARTSCRGHPICTLRDRHFRWLCKTWFATLPIARPSDATAPASLRWRSGTAGTRTRCWRSFAAKRNSRGRS